MFYLLCEKKFSEILWKIFEKKGNLPEKAGQTVCLMESLKDFPICDT